MSRRGREERGPWYLLTGLVIGVIAGVLYAWGLQPVEYTDTKPASLRADFKDQYRALIAAAYLANGDLVRARARLDLLKDKDPYSTLAEQAQRTLAGASASGQSGGGIEEARALGLLAVALGQPPPTLGAPGLAETQASAPTASAAITPTLNLTPELSPTQAGSAQQTGTPQATRATVTPLPTRTATPTPGSLFALTSEALVCEIDYGAPLIIVRAFDASGQGVPGVKVVVSWSGGENSFFTGLKPELGLGYADFSMDPGVVYTLRLAEGGQIVPDLTASECQSDSGERFWGAWELVFKQP